MQAITLDLPDDLLAEIGEQRAQALAREALLVRLYDQGASAQEIADEFTLTLAEVYATLAYYYDHREEIDRDIAAADQLHKKMAARYPNGWSPSVMPL